MNVTIKGNVKYISEVQTVGSKNFQKRNVIVEETEGDYPNTYPVEFSGKNVEKADNLKVGDFAVLECNLNGRAWEKDGKPTAFASIQCWKVANDAQVAKQEVPAYSTVLPKTAEDDGLPF